MTAPLPNLRYERKFVVDGLSLAEVVAGLHRHSLSFREVYPYRTVNNIYFDSPARRDYHDHINGMASRIKTRVRWYGQDTNVVEHPRLERKLKRGLTSGKEAYALASFHLNEGCRPSLFEGVFDTAALTPGVALQPPPPGARSLQLLPAAVLSQPRCPLSPDTRFPAPIFPRAAEPLPGKLLVSHRTNGNYRTEVCA